MLDLLIHNATLPDGRSPMAIAVQDGRIIEVAAVIDAPARETIDAQGLLVSPPFVDAHFHMDATLSYGMPRVNQSGTLLEGIKVWGELKPVLTAEAVINHCRSKLATFKVPGKVVFVDSLPRGATEKVLKRQLRADLGLADPFAQP